MALTISTGFVVDDAIVMIENIARYIEEGETPLEAALKGSEQIGFTIVSLTVSLIAVLIPLLFMGDIVGPAVPRVRGDAERDDPDLGGRLADADADDVRAAAAAQARVASRAASIARRSACFERDHRVLRRHAAVGAAASAADAAGRRRRRWRCTICLYIIIPKGFFPVQDTGVILGISEAPQTVSFAAMAERQQALAAGHPAGSGGGEPVVVHRRRRHQHHAQQRAHSDQSEAARGARASAPATSSAACSRKLASVEGITLYMQPVQDLTVEDRVSRTQYQYSLEDPDAKELADWVPQLRRQAAEPCRSCATSPATSRTSGLQAHAGHRPRHRVAAGHHAADDRRHAVRRLRPAAGLDHVHPAEPVSRGAGSRARVPAAARTT